MGRVQTMVQLNDALVAELDELATREGVSRSALIRKALADHLDRARSSAIGQRIAAGYRACPPATPDEWGAPPSLGDVGNLETLQRLDAEERAAGHAPW